MTPTGSETTEARQGLAANGPCWCGSGRKYKRCHRMTDLGVGPVRPGRVSPMLPVPEGIERPDYATSGTPGPRRNTGPKTPEQIERMRRACQVAAAVLAETGQAVAPGVTTDELDRVAHAAYLARGAYPSTLNYHGYPKSICTSVNEVICHGIPDDRPLAGGDIVNIDVTAFLDGMHGDCSATFLVGQVDAESRRLVEMTRRSWEAGIAAVRPGRPISDIGRAIQEVAEPAGYGVVRMFVGHGIGESFHAAPSVPHFYEPSATTVMEPGMTFTIEPMITMGQWRHRMWDNGWTAVTADGRRTAQFEHTVLVTATGCEILTLTD